MPPSSAVFRLLPDDSLRALRGLASRLRFTPGLLVVITAVGLLTGTVFRSEQPLILRTIGFDFDTLQAGRLYVLPLVPLVQEHAGLTWHLALQVALYVGALEFFAGPWMAWAVFFTSDLIASVGSALLFRGLAAAGSATAASYLHTPDLGSSAGMLGALAAASTLAPRRLRAPAVASLILVTVFTLLFIHREYPFEHALGAAAGLLCGWAYSRRDRPRRPASAPPAEVDKPRAPMSYRRPRWALIASGKHELNAGLRR
ncbi:MAG TPA: hypothetical protein VNN10_12325 [Dehalococcoidia bacterium]|nr:hypothetical protein [Dehalococcoidia bacterium]